MGADGCGRLAVATAGDREGGEERSHDVLVEGMRYYALLVVRMLLVVRPGTPSSFLLL